MAALGASSTDPPPSQDAGTEPLPKPKPLKLSQTVHVRDPIHDLPWVPIGQDQPPVGPPPKRSQPRTVNFFQQSPTVETVPPRHTPNTQDTKRSLEGMFEALGNKDWRATDKGQGDDLRKQTHARFLDLLQLMVLHR